MMTERFDRLLDAAVAEGLLPADARRRPIEGRPWPVVVLIAIGAWLAALPLLVAVGIFFGDFLTRGAGPYVVGSLLLSAAVIVLRAREVPPFVEQLVVPVLLVGAGTIGFGIFRDLHERAGCAALAGLALAVGFGIPRAWLRNLVGFAAAGLTTVSLTPASGFLWTRSPAGPWLAVHTVLAIWLGTLWLQRAAPGDGSRAHAASAVESLAAGWLLGAIACLAVLSGMSFLVGSMLGAGATGDIVRELGQRQGASWQSIAMQAGSALLAALATGVCAYRWVGLRRAANAPVAVVLVVLGWFIPQLGGALLALAVSATTQRYRLADAAGFAVVWIVGSFYYQLHWPLATKAVVLTACGALLGGLAWLTHRRGERSSAGSPARLARSRESWVFVVVAALTLAVVNAGIWQKETLIATGQPIFVELAPVDPRSLMQGDYMRLNFRIPGEVISEAQSLLTSDRPRVVGRRGPGGVLTLLRLYRANEALAADEMIVELTPKDGRWILVSDAWFFREGDAKRWAAARFGEFRVAPDGQALLVGLADANLEPLRP
ncbi:GDYXXLXY domain-containing protein [Accumulibacter sp.]|uniref:GDYXXLXY domain-containing protein n=1 Tax=Accumulibacter sp. TaxID=2053492 RepID=UPI0025D63080|nr:GDYXXLXY domain-containing protein [Accumulibacter sp.]MCM8595387.1 GDYXXLXY domain-containing protein [Accumulibacter sp.]MCM8626432.1 GDYXXLXY domain-containing protein [Accumulibacter sp.]MDS4049534.1 GDYXXLXY domain-containing protein [Accumulibacter sp.]